MESLEDKIAALSTGKIYEILLMTLKKADDRDPALSDWDRNFIYDNEKRLKHSYPSPRVSYFIVKIAMKIRPPLPILAKYGIDIPPPEPQGEKAEGKYDIIARVLKSIPKKIALKVLGKQWGYELIESHRPGKHVTEKMAKFYNECLNLLAPFLERAQYAEVENLHVVSYNDGTDLKLCPEWCLIANAICREIVVKGLAKETKLMRLLSEYSEEGKGTFSYMNERQNSILLQILDTPNAAVNSLIEKLFSVNDDTALLFADLLADFRKVHRKLDIQDKVLSVLSVTEELKYPARIRNLAHEMIRYLAGNCDFAHAEDNIGFNKLDTTYGHALADLPVIENKHMPFAVHCVRFYRKQLPSAEVKEILEFHKKLLAGEMIQETDESQSDSDDRDPRLASHSAYLMLYSITGK